MKVLCFPSTKSKILLSKLEHVIFLVVAAKKGPYSDLLPFLSHFKVLVPSHFPYGSGLNAFIAFQSAFASVEDVSRDEQFIPFLITSLSTPTQLEALFTAELLNASLAAPLLLLENIPGRCEDDKSSLYFVNRNLN